MKTQEIKKHVEQLSGTSFDLIQDTWNYLYDLIDGDEYLGSHFQEPENANLLNPFIEPMKKLLFHEDDEFRMNSAEYLGWCQKDDSIIDSLIELIIKEKKCTDAVENAMISLAQLDAKRACDSIYNRAISDLEEEGIETEEFKLMMTEICHYHLLALGKLNDERAFEILEYALENDLVDVDIILETINSERSKTLLNKYSKK